MSFRLPTELAPLGRFCIQKHKHTDSSLAQSPRLRGSDWPMSLPLVVCVCMEHLRVVHVPQQGISLRVKDEVSPLEAAAGFLLLDVQEAAHTVQPVQVRHAYVTTYHCDQQRDR